MILIDKVRKVAPTKRYKYMTSCHMVSTDSLDELCEFAEFLGLNPDWLQLSNKGIPHFDMTKSTLERLGSLKSLTNTKVELVSSKELVRRAWRYPLD